MEEKTTPAQKAVFDAIVESGEKGITSLELKRKLVKKYGYADVVLAYTRLAALGKVSKEMVRVKDGDSEVMVQLFKKPKK